MYTCPRDRGRHRPHHWKAQVPLECSTIKISEPLTREPNRWIVVVSGCLRKCLHAAIFESIFRCSLTKQSLGLAAITGTVRKLCLVLHPTGTSYQTLLWSRPWKRYKAPNTWRMRISVLVRSKSPKQRHDSDTILSNLEVCVSLNRCST